MIHVTWHRENFTRCPDHLFWFFRVFVCQNYVSPILSSNDLINNCMGSREMRAASGLWTVNKVVNSAAARPRPRPHRTPRALHPLWVDTISSVLSIIHSTATTYLSCIYISMRTICGWWRVSTTQLLHLCSSHAHNANVGNLDMYQWVFSYSGMVAGMDAICMLIKAHNQVLNIIV